MLVHANSPHLCGEPLLYKQVKIASIRRASCHDHFLPFAESTCIPKTCRQKGIPATMSFAIREGAASDEQQVVNLWEACNLTVSYNDSQADYHFALEGSASTALVAENGAGEIVRSVMVGHDGHRGWLYYLAAAPHARGTGIGRSMVAAGEDWLKQRQVRKVQRMVRPTNTAVVSFYSFRVPTPGRERTCSS